MTDEIKFGLTYGGLTGLSAMDPVVHTPTSVNFYPYAIQQLTGARSAVGTGNPSCVLYWKTILRTQRDELRTYIPSPAVSASLYFMLPTNEGNLTYAYYTGNLVWPQKETYYHIFLTDFTLTIYNLVTYTP